MASVKDLTPFGINLRSCRLIAEDDYRRLVNQGCRPLRGDVLIAKDGASALDTVCEVKEDLDVVLLSSVAILRPNPQVVTPTYLRYALESPVTRRHMKGALITGAAIPRVILADFKRALIPIPPISEQQKVAALMSAYDDLIENNSRRIEILAEAAQAIYREWFVELRFPGYEEVALVDSELGPIPEGWTVSTVGAATDLVSRGVSPTYAGDSKQLVINQRCIRNGRLMMDVARSHATKVPGAKLVRMGDVLINSTGVGTLGRVAQVYEELAHVTVDSHVTIVRPNQTVVSIDYFGMTLLDREAEFETMGVGSTGQTELSRTRISEELVLLPQRVLQDRFSKIVGPVRLLAARCAAGTTVLGAIRELVLPRLVSGEIDVSNLDIEMSESIE